MITRNLIKGLAGLIWGLMMSCEKKVEATFDKEQIKAEIQAVENAYAAALNRGDAKSASEYYADNATSFPYGEKPLVGEKAIIDAMQKDITAIPEGYKITFTANEVIVPKEGDPVLEIGYYILTDPAGKNVMSGNFFSIFEKRDGKYVCIRDISTPDIPPNGD